MKKSLFTLFILLFCQNAFCQFDGDVDYIFSGVNHNDERYVYFNKNIRKNEQIKNTYFVWAKWLEFGNSKKSTIDMLSRGKQFYPEIKNEEQLFYYIELYVIDISTHKYKSLSRVYYDNFNSVIYSLNYKESEEDWIYAVPNSMVDRLILNVKSHIFNSTKKTNNKK